MHGQPDFGMYSLAKTTYRLADMGELAARLGSIVTFDRRGDVILLDNFEDNINKWELYPGGTGASIALSTDTARNGGKCAKLVTGSTIGDAANLLRACPYAVKGKFGAEISVSLHDSLDWFLLGLSMYDGAKGHSAGIRYLPLGDDLKYQDSAMVFQVLEANKKLLADDNLFHTFKLVVDFENDKYVRLIVNEKTYDMSDKALYTVANTTSPYLLASIQTYSRVAGNITSYIDDFILTQNEP